MGSGLGGLSDFVVYMAFLLFRGFNRVLHYVYEIKVKYISWGGVILGDGIWIIVTFSAIFGLNHDKPVPSENLGLPICSPSH